MTDNFLFKGIAVVIDDEVEDVNANIHALITQIGEKQIPCLKYSKLPDDGVIDNLRGVSFVLLDWRLQQPEEKEGVAAGVAIPKELKEYESAANIAFLKKLHENLFAPIFIFTNETIETVVEKLKENGLYEDSAQNYIFVKSKDDLTKGNLFEEISAWVQNTPSVYVLKVWDNEYSAAKNKLFNDLYALSPTWPKILWQNFNDDGVNPSNELGDVLTKNLHSRMAPFSFEDGTLKINEGETSSRDEIRTVLGGERFIKNESLNPQSIVAGDFFKKKGKYYINIRPDCDCIPGRSGGENAIDEVNLYLLEAEKMNQDWETSDNTFNQKYGLFPEQDNQCIVFCMHDNSTFIVKFKNMKIEKWADYKDKRLGRLIPPYVTKLQQKYALYMQRQGLPRIPKHAIFEQTAEAPPTE